MRFVGGVLVAVSAITLVGCSSDLQPATSESGTAITYSPTGSDWEMRSQGRLELTESGCLVIKGMSIERPTVLAGVPSGTTFASDGAVEFPGLERIELGDALTFSQEPFHGTGADLPTTEPRTSGLPDGCDPSRDVVLIIPLAGGLAHGRN